MQSSRYRRAGGSCNRGWPSAASGRKRPAAAAASHNSSKGGDRQQLAVPSPSLLLPAAGSSHPQQRTLTDVSPPKKGMFSQQVRLRSELQVPPRPQGAPCSPMAVRGHSLTSSLARTQVSGSLPARPGEPR